MARTKKRHRTRRIIALAFGFFLISASPLFALQTVEITPMESLSEENIMKIADISKGDNIVYMFSPALERRLKSNPYIARAKVRKVLPHTLKIEIDERKARGYAPYMDSYLYIDEYGTVLDIQANRGANLPIVRGLNFSSFKLGEKLEVENDEAFDIIVKMAQIITKYEALEMVTEIDVSKTDDIKAISGKITVNLGDITDMDEKIRALREILNNMPGDYAGTLDLSDIRKPFVFQYMT